MDFLHVMSALRAIHTDYNGIISLSFLHSVSGEFTVYWSWLGQGAAGIVNFHVIRTQSLAVIRMKIFLPLVGFHSCQGQSMRFFSLSTNKHEIFRKENLKRVQVLIEFRASSDGFDMRKNFRSSSPYASEKTQTTVFIFQRYLSNNTRAKANITTNMIAEICGTRSTSVCSRKSFLFFFFFLACLLQPTHSLSRPPLVS